MKDALSLNKAYNVSMKKIEIKIPVNSLLNCMNLTNYYEEHVVYDDISVHLIKT